MLPKDFKMKNVVNLVSDSVLRSVLCSSAAVLLIACSGTHTDGANGQQAQAGANRPTRLLAMSVAVSAAATPQEQITQLYLTLLGRQPDAAGLQWWIRCMNNGMTIDQVAAYIKASAEYIALHGHGNPGGGDTGGGTTGIPATTYNYYVSPTGSDSAAGSKAAPFKSLQRAAQVATKASTTIWVAPGTYAGGLKTTANGTASGRIYWVSTTKWGAKIVPPSSSRSNYAWDNRGNYVSIIGFDVDGSQAGSGTKWLLGLYNGGSYGVIQGNHVHNIAQNVTCNGGGGSAINIDSYYHGVSSDVISNVVHDIGMTSCTFIQGIYVSTSGRVMNNLVYRIGEAGIHLWHDAHDVTITNNTVTASGYGVIVGGGNTYFYTAGDDNTVVNNNIFFDNKYGISEQGKTGKHNSYNNNLVYQNSVANISLRNGLTANNTVASNPLFVGYSRTGTPDMHLTSSSPAVSRGTPAGAMSSDLDGKPRNAATGYDIGAYQQ
jgi:hypothetical protein